MINASSSANLPFKFCANHKFDHPDPTTTILTCVITSLLIPITVAGNALVLAAIWRNPSLRTPSYAFLFALALTDLCSGIFCQPSYVIYRIADLKVYKSLYCVTSAIAHSTVPYFLLLTAFTITAMSVERWLHMSRRSFITVHRVLVIEAVLVLIPMPYMAARGPPGMEKLFDTDVPIAWIFEGVTGFPCFAISSLAYFKVFRIIRQHQQQIRANTHSHGARQASIDFEKYKRSVHTIILIMLLFLLCYLPYILLSVFLKFLDISNATTLKLLQSVTTAMIMCPSLNPLLYIWRLKKFDKKGDDFEDTQFRPLGTEH